MREPRNLSARIVLVNDVALRCLHQFRFRARHGLYRCIAVAGLDRFLDNANRAAHLGATRLVDNGAAGNLARRLFGGTCIGHGLNYPSAVTDRDMVGAKRTHHSNARSTLLFFSGVPDNAMRWSKYALITAPLKEQRRRD